MIVTSSPALSPNCQAERCPAIAYRHVSRRPAPARRSLQASLLPGAKAAVMALTLAAFGCIGVVHAADGELSRGDTRFLQKAAQNGTLEIEASKLAAERARNPQVKEFARRMLTDHPPVDEELRALAKSKQVELQAEPGRGQSRILNDLQDKSGADFDERYADKIAVDAHDEAVSLFEDAAQDAQDADVKAFAAKHLPALKLHLEMGTALQDAISDNPQGVVPQRDETPSTAAPQSSGVAAGGESGQADAAASARGGAAKTN